MHEDEHLLARCSELESTLRRHHLAIYDAEKKCDDTPEGQFSRHHMGEARRLVALAIAQLYIARRRDSEARGAGR